MRLIKKIASTLVFAIVLMSVFVGLPLAEEEPVRRSYLNIEKPEPPKWYGAINLKPHNFTCISAKVKALWNKINSFDYWDFVVGCIGVGKYSPLVGWETFQVGVVQDNKGLRLYIEIKSRKESFEKFYPAVVGEVYDLQIEFITDRFLVGSVGEHEASMYFYEDCDPERFGVAQAESGDPSNTLKEYIFDIQYDGKLWGDDILVHEDRPYQVILKSLFSTIQGDANSDYSVDMYDAGEISAHWHQKLDGKWWDGPEGYDKSVDLTHDGEINFDDVGRVQAFWQWSW